MLAQRVSSVNHAQDGRDLDRIASMCSNNGQTNKERSSIVEQNMVCYHARYGGDWSLVAGGGVSVRVSCRKLAWASRMDHVSIDGDSSGGSSHRQ